MPNIRFQNRILADFYIKAPLPPLVLPNSRLDHDGSRIRTCTSSSSAVGHAFQSVRWDYLPKVVPQAHETEWTRRDHLEDTCAPPNTTWYSHVLEEGGAYHSGSNALPVSFPAKALTGCSTLASGRGCRTSTAVIHNSKNVPLGLRAFAELHLHLGT